MGMLNVISVLLVISVIVGGAGPVSAQYWEDDWLGDDTASRPDISKEDTFPESAAQIQYPPNYGPRKTLAVLEFENKAKGSWGSSEIGEGMAEMLTTELFNTNRFILVERSALEEILKEQELGQTGLVRAETAATVGSLAGAQLLIKGVVSEFEYKKEGKGFGFGIEQFNLGLKSSHAHVGIDVRVIDATTGQIIASEYAKGKAKASGFSIDYEDDDTPLRVGTGAFNKTPLGKATRSAIQQAVRFIIGESEKHAWSGLVIKATPETAYINRGANSNIQAGNRLSVYSRGEALIDPQTGINLGCLEKRVGSLVITDVKDKFSIGRLQLENPGAVVKRGDIVRLE
jgi:curli biogenesis system outer membrane secretion channel CsgG